MRNIILASGSPRRKEILSKLKIPFIVVESGYEENMTLALKPAKLAEYLSAGKAKHIAEAYPDSVIIAADTFVVIDDQILGKPKTSKRAKEMLRMLNGKEYRVVTGVTILDTATDYIHSFNNVTKIFMKKLSDDTLTAYAETDEPLDKAGACAFSDTGAIFIERIDGDFFNAMGLPLSALVDELQKFGVNVI